MKNGKKQGKQSSTKKDLQKKHTKPFQKESCRRRNYRTTINKCLSKPLVYGEVKYVKFNFEHNTKLLKALKGLGYNYSINIIEDKCKK